MAKEELSRDEGYGGLYGVVTCRDMGGPAEAFGSDDHQEDGQDHEKPLKVRLIPYIYIYIYTHTYKTYTTKLIHLPETVPYI